MKDPLGHIDDWIQAGLFAAELEECVNIVSNASRNHPETADVVLTLEDMQKSFRQILRTYFMLYYQTGEVTAERLAELVKSKFQDTSTLIEYFQEDSRLRRMTPEERRTEVLRTMANAAWQEGEDI